jgi:uncharacterized protein
MLSSVSPSKLIRSARRSAGLTQVELARRLGTTQPVVARLENPDANPTLATIERALEAAGYGLELRAVPKQRSGVDESQLLERLAWTPAERLAAHTVAQRNLGTLLRSARRSDDGV